MRCIITIATTALIAILGTVDAQSDSLAFECVEPTPETDLAANAEACENLSRKVGLADTERAAALRRLGQSLRSLDVSDRALDYLLQARKLVPGEADTEIQIARAYLDRRDGESAAATLQALIAVDPENAKAFGDLGTALEFLGQYDKAAAAYERAVALDTDQLLTAFNLAKLYLRGGDSDACVAVLNRISARGSEEMARIGLARALYGKDSFELELRSLRGFVQEQSYRYEDARADLEWVLERGDRSEDVVLAYAEVLLQMDGRPVSIQFLERVRHQVDGWRTVMRLADSLARSGRRGEATLLLEEIGRRNDGSPIWRIQRARLDVALGNEDLGRERLEAAMLAVPELQSMVNWRMNKFGYLMEIPGLDPGVAHRNALSACLVDRQCSCDGC